MTGDSGTGRERWTRSYPPLVALVAVAVVAVWVLPSSLNLPQANPTTVNEFAPVPPQDGNPDPRGNLSALGLGSSQTLALPVTPPPPPPPPEGGGRGAKPTDKHCIGSPPRQTEDPASPPCVPYFDGDNFGATYHGVTRREINVVAYFQIGWWDTETTPQPGTIVDGDQRRLPACPHDTGGGYTDARQCDHIFTRVLKSFTHYFNNRFQTYGRHVHFFGYYSGANTASERRSDAVVIYDLLKPFAVMDETEDGGYNVEFATALAQLGVLSFSSALGSLPNTFYRKVAPLAWGFYPDIEHWAAQYGSYVCQKVAPYPVRRFGNPPGAGPPNGQRRRFGLWWTTDQGRPEYRQFADLVKQKLRKCHANVVSEATTSYSGYSVNGADRGTEAAQAVAKFQQANVSTVIYMTGEEGRFSAAAGAVHYYPEIVVAGDLVTDGFFAMSFQDQDVWQNAWGTTFALREGRSEETPGYRAYKEGDPSGDNTAGYYGAIYYRDYFMLLTGIQVAGPRLTPTKIDEGFHAIPEKSSDNPYVAALYFDANDYTSVKDSAEQWWDPHATESENGGATPGCYRMVNQGRRSLADKWTGGDQAFRNPSDPCNQYNGGARIQTGEVG